jgi:glucosamine--fructose-6-phosphate aminotransferase (isomerizing)
MNKKMTDTILFREIQQQPQTLQRLLDAASEPVQELARAIAARQITHIIIAARGTSDNAGRYAQYVLGARNSLQVALATPSLFSIYHSPPRLHGALVLGISQSGQSPDIISVLSEARRQDALTAVITNAPQSDLARRGDVVIPIHAGEERAVAATKSYTGQLLAIAMLSAQLAGDGESLSSLRETPQAVAATLKMNDAIAIVAPRYRYMDHCVVIGRGYNYATAFETALKLKELTYTIVEPYSSADFLHGPLAMVEQGFPVVVIAPSGKMTPILQEFLETVQQRRAEIIAISDEQKILQMARVPLPLPHAVPEWLSPITAIVPGQLLALHLAWTRDYDVDDPRAIQKITETR